MTGVWVFLVRVFEIVAERTAVGLAAVFIVGGVYGWTHDNVAVLWIAFVAAGVLLWMLFDDPRRWEEKS